MRERCSLQPKITVTRNLRVWLVGLAACLMGCTSHSTTPQGGLAISAMATNATYAKAADIVVDVVLRNNSTQACTVVNAPELALNATVSLDGVPQTGRVDHVSYDDGYSGAVASSLVTLDPGVSQTIRLRAVVDDSAASLQTLDDTTGSPEVAFWNLSHAGHYEMAVSYGASSSIALAASQMCSGPNSPAKVEFDVQA